MVLRTERQTQKMDRRHDNAKRRRPAIALDNATGHHDGDRQNSGHVAEMHARRPIGLVGQTGQNAAGMDSDDVSALRRFCWIPPGRVERQKTIATMTGIRYDDGCDG